MTPPAPSRFEFQDFARVFGLAIFLYAGFNLLFTFLPGAATLLDELHPTVSFLITYLIQFVILFFPLWIFVIEKRSASVSDFGFRKAPFLKCILTIIGAYIAYIVISVLITTFLFQNGLEIPGYKAQESYIPLFGDDPLGLITAFLVIVAIAPLLEEIFFRGFIYSVLSKIWPVAFASIITAALFALIHFQFNNFFPIFILGLLLNFSYQRTGSLWTSIGFHALNNAVAFGLDVYLHYNHELLESLV